MKTGAIDMSICCLCGKPIDSNAAIPDDALSMDHVPPKQFYPKELRRDRNLNLWLAPTHKHCNEDYRKDEEYFYHAMYGIVQKNSQQMGQTIFRDFARRTHKQQTPAMMRSILKTFTTVTSGGIHLPSGIVQFSVDQYRCQRVVIKIAQGLFYLDRCIHMPRENCKDIRICLEESDVPELYSLSWQGADSKMVCGDVFSYRQFEIETLHLFSLLFWESLMFCCAFEDPLKCDD
ncbi:MAG: hypothetical protein ABSE63_05750 [Thermoguttaceae bacterium]|jgi:hypothetical protein